MHKPTPLYRLTLTAEAFGLVVAKSKPLSGKFAILRPDGKWDIGVTVATADTLFQMATEGENLSDTVIRLLNKEGV